MGQLQNRVILGVISEYHYNNYSLINYSSSLHSATFSKQ